MKQQVHDPPVALFAIRIQERLLSGKEQGFIGGALSV